MHVHVQVKLNESSNGMNTKTGFPVTALRETNVLLSLQHENIIRVREMVVGTSMDQVSVSVSVQCQCQCVSVSVSVSVSASVSVC